MNLKEVTCEKCKRVIGRRAGHVFHYQGIEIKFNKSARMVCPFPDCRLEQDFKINRDQNAQPKIPIDNENFVR